MHQGCAAVLCEYTSLGGGGDTPGWDGQWMSPWGDAAPQVSWPCWGWRWLRWGNASSPACCRTSCGMRCACSTWYGPVPCPATLPRVPGLPVPRVGRAVGANPWWPYAAAPKAGCLPWGQWAQLWGPWWHGWWITHRYEDPDGIDAGTVVTQLVGVWWQLVGRWWHRYGDSIGTDMGTLVAQVWGPWWGRYGDSIGTDMGTLVAQL